MTAGYDQFPTHKAEKDKARKIYFRTILWRSVGLIDRVCTLTGLKEDSCAWAGLSTAECAGVTAARGCGLIPFTGKILIGFVPSVGTQKEATEALGKGAFPQGT